MAEGLQQWGKQLILATAWPFMGTHLDILKGWLIETERTCRQAALAALFVRTSGSTAPEASSTCITCRLAQHLGKAIDASLTEQQGALPRGTCTSSRKHMQHLQKG